MKNKFLNSLITLSLITSQTLMANDIIRPVQDWDKYPIPKEITSVSRGGDLVDNQAVTDGLGVILLHSTQSNNQSNNNLPYNKLLTNNLGMLIMSENNLKDLIINDVIIVPPLELNLINNGNTFVNGNNPNGAPCDDLNPITSGEKWISNICTGGIIPNGTPCDDNSENTINDMYNNSICVGTYRSGNCDDGNIETIADIYNAQGVCIGENVQGKPCNDNNVETVNDVYNNGVCNGLSAPNGTVCDDNDVNTLNDVWFNGICKGKIVVQKTTCVNAYVGSEWADARTSGLAVYNGILYRFNNQTMLWYDNVTNKVINKTCSPSIYTVSPDGYEYASCGYGLYSTLNSCCISKGMTLYSGQGTIRSTFRLTDYSITPITIKEVAFRNIGKETSFWTNGAQYCPTQNCPSAIRTAAPTDTKGLCSYYWKYKGTMMYFTYSGNLQSSTGYESLSIINTTTNTCASNLTGNSTKGVGLCIK